jgi:Spy/CpxP family protein refolding chaperone
MRAARVDARLKGMSQMLALTDDQKAKIKPLLEDEFKQYEELQQDKALAPEERMKKFREVRESMQAKIKPILTAEQQQKLESRQRPPQRKPAVPGAPAPAPAK